MRCMLCGEEMRLVQTVPDETMIVPGFEHHTFHCAACHDEERRLVFVREPRLYPRPSRLNPLPSRLKGWTRTLSMLRYNPLASLRPWTALCRSPPRASRRRR